MTKRYADLEYEGHTFRFYFEPGKDGIFHIAESGFAIDDVLDIFFDGSRTMWLLKRECFETLLGNRGLWWNWVDQEKKHVRVISVFTRYR